MKNNNFIVKASNQMERLPTQFFSTLVGKVNSFIASGYDVINLGQGNPDRPTPPHIVQSLQNISSEFTDTLLEKAKVVVAPGIGFGKHGEGYVRLGLIAEEERIREAVQRISKLAIF